MLRQLRLDLKSLSNPAKAKLIAGFFKTGKGHYGEGDVFLGIQVPDTRAVAKRHIDLSLKDISTLLSSPVHEERLAALLILVEQHEKGSGAMKTKVFNFYVKNAGKVNNWDLVDLSAPKIVGEYLLSRENGMNVLLKLAKSDNLWEKRISVVATYAFIRQRRFEETFAVAKLLLNDKHDLIHKAVGWMLREVGKRDLAAEVAFLDKYCKVMPRTMLRYAIERFSPGKREYYLKS